MREHIPLLALLYSLEHGEVPDIPPETARQGTELAALDVGPLYPDPAAGSIVWDTNRSGHIMKGPTPG